jgi:hypothetical protein
MKVSVVLSVNLVSTYAIFAEATIVSVAAEMVLLYSRMDLTLAAVLWASVETLVICRWICATLVEARTVHAAMSMVCLTAVAVLVMNSIVAHYVLNLKTLTVYVGVMEVRVVM